MREWIRHIGRETKAWRIHSATHHFEMFPLCFAYKASWRQQEKRSHRNSSYILSVSHSVLSVSSLPRFLPPPLLSTPLFFLLFYICLWQSLCCVCSAEVCDAKRQNDKEESDSADAAFSSRSLLPLPNKSCVVFPADYTAQLVLEDAAWCIWCL